MQHDSNKTAHTTGNIPLPLAIVKQWLAAHEDDTNAAWHYVAGLFAGCIIARPEITEELLFLHGVARQRGFMAVDESILPEKSLAQSIETVLAGIADLSAQMKELRDSLTRFMDQGVRP